MQAFLMGHMLGAGYETSLLEQVFLRLLEFPAAVEHWRNIRKAYQGLWLI